MIKISDEIKAKITIEADTSGADEAAAALEKLQGLAGNFASGEGSGGAGDALSNIGAQAEAATQAIVPLGEEASKTFDSLQEGGSAVSEVSGLLGEHQQMLLGTGEAYKALQEPVGTTVAQLQEASAPMALIAEHAQSMNEQLGHVGENFAQIQQAMDPQFLLQAAQAYQELPAPLEEYVKQLQAAVEPTANIVDSTAQVLPLLPQVAEGFNTAQENLKAFQTILQSPDPFNAFNDYLDQTQQMSTEFAASVGSENYATLQNAFVQPAAGVVENAQSTWYSPGELQAEQQRIQQLQTDTQSAKDALMGTGDATQTASENMVSFGNATEDASRSAESVASSTSVAGKSIEEVGAATEKTGGIFSEVFGEGGTFSQMSEGVSGFFGDMGQSFGDLMMGFDQVMRPLMYIQMAGQMASSIGSWIYNANLANEGGAAGGTYTYTSQVDQMMANVQRNMNALAVGIGQGLLPSIEGANDAAAKAGASTDSWKNIGDAIGNTIGFIGDALQVSGGIIGMGVGGIIGALTGNNSLLQASQGAFTSGGEGVANMIAQIMGKPMPYSSTAYTGSMPWNAGAAPYLNADTSNMTAGGSNYLTNPLSPYYGMDAQTAQAAWTQSHYTGTYGPSDPMNAYESAIARNYQTGRAGPVPAPNADVAADWAYFGSLGLGNPPMSPAISTPYGPAYGGTVTQSQIQSEYGTSTLGGWLRDIGLNPPLTTTSPDTSTTSYAKSQGWPDWSNVGKDIGSAFQGSAVGQDISQIFGGAGQAIGGFSKWVGGLWNQEEQQQGPTSFTGGCFVAGTRVLLADSTEKPIEQLQIGDCVLACHNNKQIATTVLARLAPPPRLVYELRFSNGNTLTTTDSHPIATPQGWKALSVEHAQTENPNLSVTMLHIGDFVYTVDGVRSLVSIEKKPVEQVYNISVGEPHTFYANSILVHNKGAMTNEGTGTESVSLSHTFTANVTWEANNLTKQVTAVANWAVQGAEKAISAVASWAVQGAEKAISAVASWAVQGAEKAISAVASWTEQNVDHAITAVANWTDQNIIHPVVAAANWVDQNVIHPVVAAAQWAEENVTHAATAAVKWGEENLEHTATATAQWVGENLEHTFIASASWLMGGMPAFAEGTSNAPGGVAMIAEAGSPEVVEHNGQFSLFDQPAFVNLPAGAAVYPMQDLGSASPRQLASGTVGDITPITLPIIGTGGGNPQTVNITVMLDSQSLVSAMGIPLSNSIRVGMGLRGY